MRFVTAIRLLKTALPVCAGLIGGALPPATTRADETLWQTSIGDARKLAAKQDRPLLVHFYAPWCQPCIRMDRETFAAADFRKQVAGRFILVKINSDRHPELLRQYGVTGLPSDVFVSPDGRILSRSAGYLSKRDYVTQLARWESRFVKRSKVQVAAAKPQPAGSATAGNTAQPAAPPTKVVIGMDGYSPVAMHRHRKWVIGKKRFAGTHHGIAYWMADADEFAAFRKDPGSFAPRLLGCDPVVLNETDRAIPGRVQFGAIFDGALYFFESADSRAKFRNSPLQYTRTRHVLRVDDIHGTVRR